MLRILDTTTTTQWSFRDIFQEQIYFLKFTFNRNQEAELIRTVSQFCRVTINGLLRGNNDLPCQRTVHIFAAVQVYIKNSKRF